MSVDATRIPIELFPKAKGDDSEEGIRRDMLSACFLERKLGNALYFSHRSFQEFLVAEKIVLDFRKTVGDIQTSSQAVTPEVGEFLASMAEMEDFERFVGSLRRYRGSVSLALLVGWVRNDAFAARTLQLLKGGDRNPWLFVLATAAAQFGSSILTREQVLERLSRAVSVSGDMRAMALYCATALLNRNQYIEEIAPAFGRLLVRASDAIYSEFVRSRGGRKAFRRPPVTVFLESSGVEQVLLRSISVGAATRPPVYVHLDLRRFYGSLAKAMRESVVVEDWAADARNLSDGKSAPLGVTLEIDEIGLDSSDIRWSQPFIATVAARSARAEIANAQHGEQ